VELERKGGEVGERWRIGGVSGGGRSDKNSVGVGRSRGVGRERSRACVGRMRRWVARGDVEGGMRTILLG
jgi:hypothetical protein